jgi:hypothetical protein
VCSGLKGSCPDERTTTEGTTDACLDESDALIAAKDDTFDKVAQCAIGCLGNPDQSCAVVCIMEQTGLEQDCAKCYGKGESPFTMLIPRAGHQAVSMANNVILLFGGHTGTEITSSAEVIYEYYDTEANVIRIERGGVGAMITPRNGHSGVLLDNGTVLTVGGASAPGTLVTDGEFFNPL